MASFQLYSYFRSSTSYRVRIALHLKGIDFEYHPVHLLNAGGEQNKPEYRALNATGGVPTLIHGTKVIGQSRAIIEYLDAVVPAPPLLPKDPYERALVSQICDGINCEIHPLTNLRVTQYLERNLHQTESERTDWVHHWHLRGLAAVEALVAKTAGRYCVGNEITMADLFLVPQLFASNRFQVPLDSLPNLKRINAGLLTVPAFQKAHPHSQVDTPPELRQS